jgi:hypothetical protein
MDAILVYLLLACVCAMNYTTQCISLTLRAGALSREMFHHFSMLHHDSAAMHKVINME